MREESMRGVTVLEGIAVLLFGIAAVFWPGITIVTLLYLFATYALVIGVINLISGIVHIASRGASAVLTILLGVLEVGAGVYLLRHPHVTFTTFVLLIGFLLIFRGVFGIVGAFMDNLLPTQRTLLFIVGLLSIVVGIVILFQPAASGVAFVWLLGVYALIAGPVAIAAALEQGGGARKRA